MYPIYVCVVVGLAFSNFVASTALSVKIHRKRSVKFVSSFGLYPVCAGLHGSGWWWCGSRRAAPAQGWGCCSWPGGPWPRAHGHRQSRRCSTTSPSMPAEIYRWEDSEELKDQIEGIKGCLCVCKVTRLQSIQKYRSFEKHSDSLTFHIWLGYKLIKQI
jgi:hypothetical protein